MYEAHKRPRNVFVSHCYGAIHTLRLVKWLRDEGRAVEVGGVAVLSLGAQAPVSLGIAAWIPAFILGDSFSTIQTPYSTLVNASHYLMFHVCLCSLLRMAASLGSSSVQSCHLHLQH